MKHASIIYSGSDRTYFRLKFKTAFCLLGFWLLLGSCRTTHDAPSGHTGALKSEEAFFYALHDQSLRYQTFSARLQFSLEMASGKELSSRGQLKIEKDSRLQLSIQPMLGIEMFRIELTPDSIKLLDRMNKRYIAEDYTKLEGEPEIDFNFYNLQALFTNQLFLPGETVLSDQDYKRYQWEQTKDGYLLQTKDKGGLQYVFSTNREEKLYTTAITDTAGHSIQWDYTQFQAIGDLLFPMKINGSLSTRNDLKHAVTLHYSHIDINTPLDLKFTIPPGYERVNFSQLLKSFKSL